MSKAADVTANNFEEEVIKSDIPVLVDFWAEWCGPCKALGPTIDELASDYEGKIKVMKADVQNEASLASKYGISSIPCLILFKNGEPVDRLVGLQPKPNIAAKIDAQL